MQEFCLKMQSKIKQWLSRCEKEVDSIRGCSSVPTSFHISWSGSQPLIAADIQSVRWDPANENTYTSTDSEQDSADKCWELHPSRSAQLTLSTSECPVSWSTWIFLAQSQPTPFATNEHHLSRWQTRVVRPQWEMLSAEPYQAMSERLFPFSIIVLFNV